MRPSSNKRQVVSYSRLGPSEILGGFYNRGRDNAFLAPEIEKWRGLQTTRVSETPLPKSSSV
jgi:hypothetical protein